MGKKAEMDKPDKKEQGDGLEMINMEDIGKKRKRKKTPFDYIRYGIMLVSAIVFVVAGYQLYSIFHEYSKGEKAYEDVADNFTKKEESTGPAANSGAAAENGGFAKVNVDFASLQQQNPDVKGWIQFEGISEINYPILQHPSDNNFYLKKMYNKEENTAGSIFMDIANQSNFQDYNTFIYGHNMKNLSMFGRLKEYKDQAFYQGKEFFWIYTPEANYRYQIFSMHEVKVSSGYFRTFETMGEEYTAYVNSCKEDSRYDTGVPVSGEDRIVTLSTCTAAGDNWRFLVHGKLIAVENKNAADGSGVPEEIPQEVVPIEAVPE
ncbi:MAG: class B sortase [Lachnospiraceae bacterium]|nr:class B sortase [Lachnospiraceae bacterium]